MISQLASLPWDSEAPSGPFYEITGLPVHPLVLHIPVVLLPVSAIGLIAIFASSRLRRSIGWLVMICLVVAVGGAFVAKESGEQLAAAIGWPGRHGDLGNQMFYVALALLVVGFAWYFAARMGDRRDAKVAAAAAADPAAPPVAKRGQSGIAMVLGVLMVIVAAVNLVWIVLVGHSGAEATWKGELPPAGQTAPASPSPTATTATKSYSMAVVAAHASPSDCWTVVDGNVYDLTDWESQHPGGATPIEQMCGKDATTMFRDQHGTQAKPNDKLAGFLIGTLAGSASNETASATPTGGSSATEAASASPTGTTGVYTMAEVKAHSAATDCWSVVSGNVYDLTDWEDQHPGGARRIEAMCGKDATSMFRDEHGTEKKPNSVLASYQIGTLSQ